MLWGCRVAQVSIEQCFLLAYISEMKIAIAVPCYNCELQIERVLSDLDPILNATNQILEVYIIENNSTDQTLTQALNKIEKLKNKNQFYIYQNFSNIGLGGTHKVAFTLAKKRKMTHLLILHGDNQALISDVPKIIYMMIENSGKTILGSRFSDMNNLSGYSLLRKTGNVVLNFIYTLATRKKISDLGSGLNIFRLSDFRTEDYQNFDNGFTFNMDILLYIIKKNIEFLYMPIKWMTVDQISNANALRVGVKTLYKLFCWKFSIQSRNQEHRESKLILGPS